MTEIWKDIEGYDNYEVSTLGRVRNKDSGIFIYGRKHKKGYIRINLYKNGDKTFTMHQIVAKTFLPNFYGKKTVDHKDRNKANNKLWNLKWANYNEQAQNKDNVINARNIYVLKNKYYQVSIIRNGKRHSNTFKKYEDAVAYRDSILAQFSSVNV